MRFTYVLTSVLAASAAAATTFTAQRRVRYEARHRSALPTMHGNDGLERASITQPEYSDKLAGALLTGSKYTSVTGEFVVPTAHVPPGDSESEEYCASAWVGIDGNTCHSAILQTGVEFCIQNGDLHYSAWYEWYPDAMYLFDQISISAGDSIRTSATAYNTSAGTATIENLTSGQSASYTWNGNVGAELCETSAEWIVENFQSGTTLAPLVDFGSIVFTNAFANGNIGPLGATLIDMEQDGEVAASVSVSRDSVTIAYE